MVEATLPFQPIPTTVPCRIKPAEIHSRVKVFASRALARGSPCPTYTTKGLPVSGGHARRSASRSYTVPRCTTGTSLIPLLPVVSLLYPICNPPVPRATQYSTFALNRRLSKWQLRACTVENARRLPTRPRRFH